MKSDDENCDTDGYDEAPQQKIVSGVDFNSQFVTDSLAKIKTEKKDQNKALDKKKKDASVKPVEMRSFFIITKVWSREKRHLMLNLLMIEGP